jgi:uncharacterized protein
MQSRTKLLVLAAALPFALAAQAQNTAAPAAASSPAKKELIARILKIQQPAMETMGKALAQEPVMQILDQAGLALNRLPADKREAVGKEIQADAKKYIDETVPLVQKRAVAVAPSSVGALLDKEFSEEELKQVVAILESPAYGKFQKLAPSMQRTLTEKLVADTRSQVEPKVKALEASVGKRLGVAPAPAGGASR